MVDTLQAKQTVDFINEKVDKKKLSKLILSIYQKVGASGAADVSNALKNLGFHYATRGAITLSIEDLTIPESKKALLEKAEAQIEDSQTKFEKGEITEVERYNKVIDTWSETNEVLTENVVKGFDKLNPVYMMAFSGARGNVSQVRQLVGMRGLMADSQGQIIDLPIKSNFKEGLSVTEYIISSYGARKGLVDTALKTADSGYLTRRLVDVAQDVTVREIDCGATEGTLVTSLYESDKKTLSVGEKIVGRVALDNVTDPSTGEVIVKANEYVDFALANKIDESGLDEVVVRTPLKCKLNYGICQKCYGWSLASNKPVDLGEAIGIIAAQSIGEPGTQLTMRTFHTGGVAAGSERYKNQIFAPADGVIKYDIPVREFRTRYGDVVQETTKAGKISIGSSDISIRSGTLIWFKSGAEVKKGDFIAELMEPQKGVVERATKDVISDYAGQILFEGFSADERRDRQGNISRAANKPGIIWVMQGDVYNLPPGSKLTVEDSNQIKEGDVLAETLIVSDRGGEVRFNDKLVIEESKVGKNKVKRLVQGKDVSVVIARVGADNAKFESTKQGNAWKVKGNKDISDELYTIKVVPGEKIENKSVIAELVDDGDLSVASAGEIRYSGLEVDDSRIITQPGKIIFIPEEVHYVSKDAALRQVEDYEKVSAGQEIVKEIFTQLDGYVQMKVDNDIIHEITVKPGEMHDIENPSDLKCDDGDIVDSGTEIYPGITVDETKLITLIEIPNEEDPEKSQIKLLVRPIQVFDIEPRSVNFQGYSTDANIALLSVTQMLFKDGERIRNLNGGPLTKSSLVLTMQGDFLSLKGIVEIAETPEGKEELQIVIQDNVILRREQDTNVTQLLVEDRDHIAPGAAIAKTQVLANSNGIVSLSSQEEKRLLLITGNDLVKQETTAKPTVKVGDFLKSGDKVGGQTSAACSGQIVDTEAKAVVIRRGRPYLVSTNAVLQCDQGHLVQRGDQLAALIFERVKTGDIVQGLPRVEELLEGRKSKDACILSEFDGKVNIFKQEEDDFKRLVIVTAEGENEITVPPGLNLIVEDGQEIKRGDALTDGPANPHDILALLGLGALQKYLLDEVQRVYHSQGVDISDKHVEVIIKQMTRKVRIEDPGDTILLPGELVEMKDIERETKKAKEIITPDAAPPIYTPVLLGITKASLNTESFISAASFQETTRILSEASIEGKRDWLRGLKENVIIGRLIPAGTGSLYSQAMVAQIPDISDPKADNAFASMSAATDASPEPPPEAPPATV